MTGEVSQGIAMEVVRAGLGGRWLATSRPGSPFCLGVLGATEQEALENIREAIREYLSVVNEQLRGEDIREIEVTA